MLIFGAAYSLSQNVSFHVLVHIIDLQVPHLPDLSQHSMCGMVAPHHNFKSSSMYSPNSLLVSVKYTRPMPHQARYIHFQALSNLRIPSVSELVFVYVNVRMLLSSGSQHS